MTQNVFFLINFLPLLFKIAFRSLSSIRQRIVVYKAQDQLLINFRVNKKYNVTKKNKRQSNKKEEREKERKKYKIMNEINNKKAKKEN